VCDRGGMPGTGSWLAKPRLLAGGIGQRGPGPPVTARIDSSKRGYPEGPRSFAMPEFFRGGRLDLVHGRPAVARGYRGMLAGRRAHRPRRAANGLCPESKSGPAGYRGEEPRSPCARKEAAAALARAAGQDRWLSRSTGGDSSARRGWGSEGKEQPGLPPGQHRPRDLSPPRPDNLRGGWRNGDAGCPGHASSISKRNAVQAWLGSHFTFGGSAIHSVRGRGLARPAEAQLERRRARDRGQSDFRWKGARPDEWASAS